MAASNVYIEVRRPGDLQMVPLASSPCTIGKATTNDIVLDFDPTISRSHAVIETYGQTWAVRDLGSMNGTFVNGERIFSERVLRDRDELKVGGAILIFRSPNTEPMTATVAPAPPPQRTRREQEVLVALCRPTYKGDYFAEPATVKAIAKELYVTEAAVKQHLSRLYDKFGIYEGDGERRIRLANEAVRLGAVTSEELRRPPPGCREDPEDES